MAQTALNSFQTELDGFNLEEAWNRACREFLASTKGECDLQRNPPLDPQQMLDKLAVRKAQNEEKQAKHRVVKTVLNRSLRSISLLGGIAASAASNVFPASGLCWNAVSYLINAGQNTGKIYTSFQTLFEEVGSVLERFVIDFEMEKRGDLDAPVKKICFETLFHFINICELSIKVLKRPKILEFGKVILFNEDEGVSAAIEKLRELTEREAKMKITIMHQAAKQSARDIKSISAKQDESAKKQDDYAKIQQDSLKRLEESSSISNSEKERNRQREKLKKVLGDDVLKFNHREYCKEKLENAPIESGSWIEQEELFMRWIDCSVGETPILTLSGDSGHGKSYMTSKVVKHLNTVVKTSESRSTRRVLVAYVFFGNAFADGRKETKPVISALKAMIWKLAEDEVFLKTAYNIVADLEELDDSNVNQMPEIFVRIMQGALGFDTTLFLLFDGLERLDEGEGDGTNCRTLARSLNPLRSNTLNLRSPAALSVAEGITKEPSSGKLGERGMLTLPDNQIQASSRNASRIKILLTGESKTLSEFESIWPRDNIELAPNNTEDLRKYIQTKLREMSIFKAKSTTEDQKFSIVEQVSEIVKGSFGDANLILNQIERQDRLTDVNTYLEQAKLSGGNLTMASVESTLELLNKTLLKKDIKDLNELLLYILGGRTSWSSAELDAALTLKNGEESFTSVKDKVKNEFSAILKSKPGWAGGDYVVLNDEESYREYFVNVAAARDTDLDSSNIVSDAELRIVQHFLRNVCDEELFAKFGFEEFFRQKRNPQDNKINVDYNASDLQLVKRALQVLHQPENSSLDELRYFAHFEVFDHVRDVDLSQSDPKLKASVGPLLLPVLRKKDYIKGWWTSWTAWSLRRSWFYVYEYDKYAETTMTWLGDSGIVKSLEPEDLDWVESLKQKRNKMKTPIVVLEEVAKFMASEWLESQYGIDDFNPDPVYFIYGYLGHLNASKCPIPQDDPEPGSDPTFIDECITEALNLSGLEQLCGQAMCSLGRTYHFFEHFEKAVETLEKAIDMLDNKAIVLFNLARAYFGQEKYQDAIGTFNAAMDACQSDTLESESESELPKKMQREVRGHLGECYRKLNQHDKALEIYRMLFDLDKRDLNVLKVFVMTYTEQKEWGNCIEFLQEMERESFEDVSLLARSFADLCPFGDFWDQLMEAAANTDTADYLRKQLSTTLESVISRRITDWKTLKVYECEAWLEFRLGKVLHEHPRKPEDHENAIRLWESVLKKYSQHSAEFELRTVAYFCTNMLASTVVELARDVHQNGEKASLMTRRIKTFHKDAQAIGDTSMPEIFSGCLARAYSLMGQGDKARDAIKPLVNTAFDMLSDGDSYNDCRGYDILGHAMRKLGDQKNASAALSLVTPYYPFANRILELMYPPPKQMDAEKSADGKATKDSDKSTPGPSPSTNGNKDVAKPEKGAAASRTGGNVDQPEANGIIADNKVTGDNPTEPSTSTSSSSAAPVEPQQAQAAEPYKLPKGPLTYGCDGIPCKATFEWHSGVYHCNDCNDFCLCEDHYRDVKEKGAKFKTCRAHHEFLYVPPYNPKDFENIGQDNVKVGDKIVPIKDWLNGLRIEWGLQSQEMLDQDAEAKEREKEEEEEEEEAAEANSDAKSENVADDGKDGEEREDKEKDEKKKDDTPTPEIHVNQT